MTLPKQPTKQDLAGRTANRRENSRLRRVTTGIAFNDAEITALDEAANTLCITRSEYVRRAVAAAINTTTTLSFGGEL